MEDTLPRNEPHEEFTLSDFEKCWKSLPRRIRFYGARAKDGTFWGHLYLPKSDFSLWAPGDSMVVIQLKLLRAWQDYEESGGKAPSPTGTWTHRMEIEHDGRVAKRKVGGKRGNSSVAPPPPEMFR